MANAQVTSPRACNSVDILRTALELAASKDKKIATRLVLVSRTVKEWIDPILYHTVTLRSASSTLALWRTISYSKKPASFFAQNVKVLCLSEEAHTSYLEQILLACSGVAHLTFWVVPPSDWQNSLTNGDFSPTQTSAPGPRLWLSHTGSGGSADNHLRHEAFPDDCFDALRPKRMVACFRDPSYLAFRPDLARPVFAFVTHLSILNSWEEWIFWDLGDYLPSVVYLALDLTGARRCAQAASTGRSGRNSENSTLRLTRTITDVLHKCRALRVCVLVLLFDKTPESTLERIAEYILKLEYEDSKSFPFINPPSVPDARLVFLQMRNPFVAREAHLPEEEAIWRAADRQVMQQIQKGEGPELVVL